MGHPRPLYHLFSYYQTNFRSLTTIVCGKILCPSGIRRRDSNPQPLEHESTPITTKPGLPPSSLQLGLFLFNISIYSRAPWAKNDRSLLLRENVLCSRQVKDNAKYDGD